MNKKHIKEEGLRDWFGKSKSKGGKKGWVNVVTGDSCASDKPGEGIPKCVSSSKRASMSKKERVAAQAAKRREDPGQQKKSGASKPTMVKTDRKVRKEAMEVNGALDENVSSGKSRLAKMGRVSGKPTGAITNTEKSAELKKQKDTEKSKDKAVANKVDVSGMSPFDAARVKKRAEFKAEKERLRAQKKMRREETEVLDEAKDKKGKGSGTKDACYHKVKSRYSVWPSAYASGALVKCRKVGAANWGNKSEETEFDSISFQQFQEKCWKGYEKKGMKTMFGKRYPNCVKKTKKEEIQLISKTSLDEKKGCMHNHKGEECPVHGIKECPGPVEEAVRMPAKTGNLVSVLFRFRSQTIMLKMFFPQVSLPTRSDIQDQIDKIYPGAKLLTHTVSDYEPGQPVLHAEAAAWTKKAGKNKEGGLNEKGRKSYEAQNPGSDLKAPSKKVGNPRRASFCARMKGMKKKLTSSKTANDPDSRINKSLRKWNC